MTSTSDFPRKIFNPTVTSSWFTFKDFACYGGELSLLRGTTLGFLGRDAYALVCGVLLYCLSSPTPPARPMWCCKEVETVFRPTGLECCWKDSMWHIMRYKLHQWLTACHVWQFRKQCLNWLCEIWGSHSSVAEDRNLLGCYAVLIGKYRSYRRVEWS